MRYFKLLLITTVFVLVACNKDEEEIEQSDNLIFLSEIRPEFFNHLNFNDPYMVEQIPQFLSDFQKTYENLLSQYKEGQFTSSNDLNNMRLAGMYYSFGITATTRAYLDGFITIEELIGNDRYGLFSGLARETSNFYQLELEARMAKSEEVAVFAMNVNGFNDKTYGTFMVAKQIRGRVKSSENFNNPAAQDSIIEYLDGQINDYELFFGWNTMMSQLSFTNYADSLNTFKNPKMETVLSNLNEKLVIGSIPDLNGRYAEILAPIFRFDLNMKKIDYMLNHNNVLNSQEINDLEAIITILSQIKEYVSEHKQFLFEKWKYKETISERFKKLDELKTYVEVLKNQKDPLGDFILDDHFKSKNFLQAYQCYNCHMMVK